MQIKDIISNVNIYGLEESIKASKYPMSVDISSLNCEYTPTVNKLGETKPGTGHCNFLKGIIVQFDLTFTVKAWTEAERYHWFDIVSSQSTMHKISKMDFNECFCEYVTENTKNEMIRLKDDYNNDNSAENYLKLLYNCPTGIKLTARITTNYLQLKTIYSQRKNHRLPEWKLFCDWLKTLRYSNWIIDEV